MQGAYLTDGRLLDFSQKLNMTFEDFQKTQSGHNSAAEIFKCGSF